METVIRHSQYKGIDCIGIENKRLCVKVIPKSGGKIQSIFDKKDGIEYLYQSSGETYIKPRYGMAFDDGDLSGFDDMFPTILECYYPEYPWQGTYLPDHGEVWALPWQYTLGNDGIELRCCGVKLPYQFVKRVYFSDQNRLALEYEVINNSAFDFKFIWAAHPLVNIDENSEILLPKDVVKIFETYEGSKPTAFGQICDWEQERCRVIANIDEDMCKKFYVYGKIPKGECAIYNNKTCNYIKFSFPADRVPYLGVWINWNGYHIKQKNVALEPCTGALDSIEIANRYQWISKALSINRYRWHMDIEIGNNSHKETIIQ